MSYKRPDKELQENNTDRLDRLFNKYLTNMTYLLMYLGMALCIIYFLILAIAQPKEFLTIVSICIFLIFIVCTME